MLQGKAACMYMCLLIHTCLGNASAGHRHASQANFTAAAAAHLCLGQHGGSTRQVRRRCPLICRRRRCACSALGQQRGHQCALAAGVSRRIQDGWRARCGRRQVSTCHQTGPMPCRSPHHWAQGARTAPEKSPIQVHAFSPSGASSPMFASLQRNSRPAESESSPKNARRRSSAPTACKVPGGMA